MIESLYSRIKIIVTIKLFVWLQLSYSQTTIGPLALYQRLNGRTISISGSVYGNSDSANYQITFYGTAYQSYKSNYNIGTFSRYVANNGYYDYLYYINGDVCSNGPRTFKVYLICSNDLSWDSVQEPTICQYQINIYLPEACNVNFKVGFEINPTSNPTFQPSSQPTSPTSQPTSNPSSTPSFQPTSKPSNAPSSHPSSRPSSAPTCTAEFWGEVIWDKKRYRRSGYCDNGCSGHGICNINNNCNCYTGLDGLKQWTGADCSQRTCPFDISWVSKVSNANNLHALSECSNRGICERKYGICQCFPGYEGIACQRTTCPSNCNSHGKCLTEKELASQAFRSYQKPWDSLKQVGCLCDIGYRGPSCELRECPSGKDPLLGYGSKEGRDCSGRGLCDYSSGLCNCFSGFFGYMCQNVTTIE